MTNESCVAPERLGSFEMSSCVHGSHVQEAEMAQLTEDKFVLCQQLQAQLRQDVCCGACF